MASLVGTHIIVTYRDDGLVAPDEATVNGQRYEIVKTKVECGYSEDSEVCSMSEANAIHRDPETGCLWPHEHHDFVPGNVILTLRKEEANVPEAQPSDS